MIGKKLYSESNSKVPKVDEVTSVNDTVVRINSIGDNGTWLNKNKQLLIKKWIEKLKKKQFRSSTAQQH